MSEHCLVNIENYRSRQRVRDLGEVFTPDLYVGQMLDLLNPKVWASEETVFFEPTCGHGNFVTAILEKRIAALDKKYVKEHAKDHVLYAIATALNGLWAIDIDYSNVELTRKRVIDLIAISLKSAEPQPRVSTDFLAHTLCAIQWQIHENEALSALTDDAKAISQASKTSLGKRWIKEHRHLPIEFEVPWSEYYLHALQQGIQPLIHERSSLFVIGISDKKIRRFNELAFAKDAIDSLINNINKPTERAA